MANLRNHTFEQGNLVGKVILFTSWRYCGYVGPGILSPASSLTEPRMIQGQWLGWDLSAAQIGTRSNGAAGWAGPFAR